MSAIIIYEPTDGGHVAVRLESESLWMTQEQMSELFDRERSVITKHLRNIFRDEELEETAQSSDLITETGQGLVEIVSRYTQTFLLLQRYDEGLLTVPNGTIGGVMQSLDDVRHSIASLKADLISRGEASDLFGLERSNGLVAILGNLEQSVFGGTCLSNLSSRQRI